MVRLAAALVLLGILCVLREGTEEGHILVLLHGSERLEESKFVPFGNQRG